MPLLNKSPKRYVLTVEVFNAPSEQVSEVLCTDCGSVYYPF